MFSFTEFHCWLSIRPIESLFILFGWLCFSILIVLRYDFNLYSITDFHLFLPLFITNGIHSYFIFIVLLRLYIEQSQRTNLMPTYLCRLIVQKIFVHVPLIICLITFNSLLYRAFRNKQSSSINTLIYCLMPLYMLLGWVLVKVVICKKQNHVTVMVQS